MVAFLRILLLLGLSAGSLQALVLEQVPEEEGAGNEQTDSGSQLASFSETRADREVTGEPNRDSSIREFAFPYRDHIGRVGMGSGIYLGSGYILTSAHVGCYPFIAVDGSIHRPDYQSWKVLVGSDGTETDLALFRVEMPAAGSFLGELPAVPIAKQSPAEDAPVILAGTGLAQKAEPATLKSGDKVLSVLGYHVDRKRSNLVGKNTMDQVMDTAIRSGSGSTLCFSTRFDRDSSDAQASDGDSGGASFCYNFTEARWELAGCIIAVTQKSGFVPYGSRTFLADLSHYRDQLPDHETESGESTFLVSTELDDPSPSEVTIEEEEPEVFMPM